MALPAGYKRVEWLEVLDGWQIYILDNKAYGPYKVVDRTNRLVEDIPSYGNGPWEIKPYEIIGIPEPTTTRPSTVLGMLPASWPSDFRKAVAHAIILELACSTQNLSVPERVKLQAQLDTANREVDDLLRQLATRIP